MSYRYTARIVMDAGKERRRDIFDNVMQKVIASVPVASEDDVADIQRLVRLANVGHDKCEADFERGDKGCEYILVSDPTEVSVYVGKVKKAFPAAEVMTSGLGGELDMVVRKTGDRGSDTLGYGKTIAIAWENAAWAMEETQAGCNAEMLNALIDAERTIDALLNEANSPTVVSASAKKLANVRAAIANAKGSCFKREQMP